jgi:tetratricopeptide (TPR) repeat protein
VARPRLALALAAAAVTAAAAAAAAAAEPGGADPCPERLGTDADAETLYNAGLCFEKEGSVGAAIAVFEELRRRHPQGPLAPRALARSAVLHEAIAGYDRAAALYEDYAARHAGEADALDALRRAIRLHAAVDDRRAALRAVERFVAHYGRRHPTEAAGVDLAAAAIHERAGDEDALLAHLERYLKRSGPSGGQGRAAIAHARIGAILWRRSCPVAGTGPGAGGPCRAAVRRRPRSVPRCDPAVVATRLVRRTPGLAQRARTHLETAVRLAGSRRGHPGQDRSLLEARAGAEIALLDRDLETYLELHFPAGLDFDPRQPRRAKRSSERFSAWLAAKTRLGSQLQKRYTEIARLPTRHAALAAARAAQLSASFRDELMASPIPQQRGPFAADIARAYCATLEAETQPLQRAAAAALVRCLELAPALAVRDHCVRQLHRADPKEHPLDREHHGRPEHAGPIIDLVDPLGFPVPAPR